MNLIKTAGGSSLMKSLSSDVTGGTEESNVNINILNEANLGTK
jgi:hypothetical protein